MLKFVSICTFLFTVLTASVWAAPSVPDILTQNGLTYCTHASGFSFNPQTSDAGTNMNLVTEQIYNKLFEIRNHDAKVTPELAQSYHISEDGKTILINLRKGVKFHHTEWFTPSRDFNADDVVFSLNRVLGHGTALPEFEVSKDNDSFNKQYRIFHELAKKTRFPYFESIKLKEKIERVEAVAPYQVKITLFAPDASILSHLASQYAIIFSQEYALQLNADNNLVQLDILPVGTGAYQLKDYVRSQYVRLQRNHQYWQKKAEINNIIIDLTTDRTGRLAKFFNGECNIVAYPEVSQLGLLKNAPGKFEIKSTDGMNLAFLAFNFQKEKVRNIELRRAVSQAINRKRIIENIYYDSATLADEIIPKVSWAASQLPPDIYSTYNPEQAKKILQDKNLTLNMWVLNEEQVYNPSPLKMAELIRFDLAQTGVQLNIQAVTRNHLIKALKNGSEDYDIILTGWLAGNLDPDSFMRPILSCSSQNDITNLANWCNPTLDNILDLALGTEELSLRSYEYRQAQKIILEQLPIIPIAHVKRILIADAHINGLELTPFGSINFNKLSLHKNEKSKVAK